MRRHYILRSTLIPGTIQREILPLLQDGAEFDFSYYPEFLRERFLREDLIAPPLRVVAHSSPSAQERFSVIFPEEFRQLYDFASAEALKIACNAFHALKAVFANEIADFCEQAGASAQEVMKAFCEDEKLNLSSRYLKPGAPFGGPCLDKDLRALEHSLSQYGLQGELLRAIRKSNTARLLRRGATPQDEKFQGSHLMSHSEHCL
jgi:GDP-mannose 6-dehydrogenase